MKCSFIFSTPAKDLKNFNTNSILQSKVIWLDTLCFEKTCLINNSVSIVALITLIVGMNFACLVSQSTITKMSI